jgi:hypothetical protein
MTETVAERLVSELGLSEEEAQTYVEALKLRKISIDPSANVGETLVAKGMLIRSSNGKAYVPLHPRLAVSNQFRMYQEGIIRQMKEKRLAIDKLTLELIHLYETTANESAFSKKKSRGPE